MTLTPNQSNASVQALPALYSDAVDVVARLPALPADTYNRCETFSWTRFVFDSSRSPNAISTPRSGG